MQRVGEQPSELPVEEWNLLPLVYKNAVGSRRAAWRVITSTEQEEKFKGKEELVLHAREYVVKVEGELQKIRDGILALMDKELVPSADTDETKVSYYRMKSDYYRYLAEFATGETRSKADEDARHAYAEATKIAEKDLALSSVVAQRQNHMVQTVQKTMEISQLQCIDKVSDGLVVQIEHVPQAHVVEKTVEIPQLDDVKKIVETPEIQQWNVEQIVDTPILPAVKELVEGSKVLSQNRVQQSFRGQTAETPDISLAEKTVEMPDTRTQDKTQHVVNTHGQHVVNTVEAEKPFINEIINQVTKHVEIPQLQIVEKTVEAAKHIQQERVKKLRSKFEVGHMSEVHARNRSDKENRADLTNQRHVLAIRTVQKTVEVPRVQYIDKVADIPVDVQRQGSTIPDTDDLCLNETADEDRLEQENKKRKLPTPAETVSESRADESDFDRFDELPPLEWKTIFKNIASDDEAKDDSEQDQEMTRRSRPRRGVDGDGRDPRARPRTRDDPDDARTMGPRTM